MKSPPSGGVDSNQWLPLQCEHWMNIDDFYSGKSESFFDTHARTTIMLTLTAQFNNWTLYDFKGNLCICVVSNMGHFTYTECTVLAYCDLHILT